MKLLLSGMIVLTAISALGVVYTTHENRQLFSKLYELNKQRDELDIEWGRLQLEQSTWATHGRIEKIAREKLGMDTVDYNKVMIVKP